MSTFPILVPDSAYRDAPGAGLVGWRNIVPAATLTASENNDDAPNVADAVLYTRWEGSSGASLMVDAGAAQSVDYFAATCLVTDGLDLEISNDAISWERVLTGVTARKVLFVTFDAVNARYFRVRVSGDSHIASLSIGRVSWFPPQRQGFAPPELNDRAETLVNMSQSGTPLGQRVQRQAARFSIDVSMARLSFFQSVWRPFRDHAVAQPFYFKWRQAALPAFCWAAEDVRGPRFSDPIYLKTSLDCQAIVEPSGVI